MYPGFTVGEIVRPPASRLAVQLSFLFRLIGSCGASEKLIILEFGIRFESLEVQTRLGRHVEVQRGNSAQTRRHHLRESGKIQSHFISLHQFEPRPVYKQTQLLLLDTVLHVTRCAVDLLVQRTSIAGFDWPRSHDKLQVLSPRPPLHSRHHPPLKRPTLADYYLTVNSLLCDKSHNRLIFEMSSPIDTAERTISWICSAANSTIACV